MSENKEEYSRFKRFVGHYKDSLRELTESLEGGGYFIEREAGNLNHLIKAFLYACFHMSEPSSAEIEAQKMQASREASVLKVETVNQEDKGTYAEEEKSEKAVSSPKLTPIDFSKIDFNHDGKPDIEQNIEDVMKVDVKQYVKEENTRDYIGDFDFAEDEPEIQEEQQVVQDYRSNRNRDDYDRDER